MATDLIHGTIMTLGNDFTACITDIQINGGLTRDVIETTCMVDSGGKTYRPDSVYDPGSIVVSILFDPHETIPTATAATMTIDWTGSGSVPNWTASGYVKNVDVTASQGEMLTAQVSYKLSGAVSGVV